MADKGLVLKLMVVRKVSAAVRKVSGAASHAWHTISTDSLASVLLTGN